MIYPSYGNYPLPTRDEALAAPLRSFRSWLLRIECARCQRERYLAETHMTLAGFGDHRLGDLLARVRLRRSAAIRGAGGSR
jgi:hypothetical protein